METREQRQSRYQKATAERAARRAGQGLIAVAKDNKVATYKSPRHGTTTTGVTDKQVKQLRDAGALVSVRRVRHRGLR